MDDEQLPRPEPENPRPQQHVPAFNLPPAILASLAVLIVIFAVMNLPSWSDDTLNWIYFAFSFIPARYAFPLSQQGLEWLWTPVTYSLLHGGIEHIVFNSLWLMVFAAPVARRIGALRYVIFWIFRPPLPPSCMRRSIGRSDAFDRCIRGRLGADGGSLPLCVSGHGRSQSFHATGASQSAPQHLGVASKPYRRRLYRHVGRR